jgi:hypothetical protein
MAAGLDDDRLISAMMSLESLKLHDLRIEKRREAKAKLLPTTFRVEFPPGFTPPRPLPPGITFSLLPPETPPNALELFT